MRTLWYYISYPIRLLLADKVQKAKDDLWELELLRAQIRPKARRYGMTSLQFNHQLSLHFKWLKLTRFIKNWEIKNG